ncbi:MAG TPA: hypothetical protein VIJ28_10450 [Chloroflexota bacterium]
MHTSTTRHSIRIPHISIQLSLVLAGALLAPAISLVMSGVQARGSSLATPTVHIDTAHGTEQVPALLTAGLIRFQLKDGAQPGSLTLARLNPGITQAKFEAALKKDPNAAFGLATLVGGAESNTQASAAVTIKLTAGTYLSAIQGNAPQPSLLFFTVHPGHGATTPPKATVTVREVDTAHHMGYEIPSVIPAGRDILQVVNSGDSTHEFQVMRLHAGKTRVDVAAFLASGMKGAAPADQVGGLPPQAKGGTNWLETTLTPGDYIAACSMQDTPTSKPHFMLGMIKEFTVR